MSSGTSEHVYSVLFVCTANRIRSVMAEAMLGQKVEQEGGIDEWLIESAGTWAGDGYPPMPYAIRAMAERGIDVASHSSTQVDKLPLDQFRLILVMERGHQEALTLEFPEVADRVHLISEMADDAYEIDDPVAGALEIHTHTADILERLIDEGFVRICELARESD